MQVKQWIYWKTKLTYYCCNKGLFGPLKSATNQVYSRSKIYHFRFGWTFHIVKHTVQKCFGSVWALCSQAATRGLKKHTHFFAILVCVYSSFCLPSKISFSNWIFGGLISKMYTTPTKPTTLDKFSAVSGWNTNVDWTMSNGHLWPQGE